MISDKQTNVVYLAEGLQHYMPAYERLLNALNARRVHMKNIPLTKSKKHIWARDYMPIQLDKHRFLLYSYQSAKNWGWNASAPTLSWTAAT